MSLFIEPQVGDGQRTSVSESANAANRPHVKQRKYTPVPSTREERSMCPMKASARSP
jgi:hypothetical protein